MMNTHPLSNGLRSGQRVGKYRLSRKIAEGGSGTVWKARDTVEGIWVALKIPHTRLDGTVDDEAIRKEVRLVASLRHPNIMPIKNADVVDGRVVLATELSVGTLADRHGPMMPRRVLDVMRQVLRGLAFAHQHRVVHCDVTPGNIFLLPDGRAALGDFGISRYHRGRMVTMDEFGTPGYVAPEQAYGKPRFASDCFAVGLIIYEYITGYLPRWPFEWPPRRIDRLRHRTNWTFTRVIRRALELSPRKRFTCAEHMLGAVEAAAGELLDGGRSASKKRPAADWRKIRRAAFIGKYDKILNVEFDCITCGEPISELMNCCPWCGETRNRFEHASAFPYYCEDCHKGVLPEWPYCPWCYGAGFAEVAERRRPDRRYKAKCRHCHGKLMPFMHFCPWCRRKVLRPWVLHPFAHRCDRCHWSVDPDFWSYCPWCAVKF